DLAPLVPLFFLPPFEPGPLSGIACAPRHGRRGAQPRAPAPYTSGARADTRGRPLGDGVSSRSARSAARAPQPRRPRVGSPPATRPAGATGGEPPGPTPPQLGIGGVRALRRGSQYASAHASR